MSGFDNEFADFAHAVRDLGADHVRAWNADVVDGQRVQLESVEQHGRVLGGHVTLLAGFGNGFLKGRFLVLVTEEASELGPQTVRLVVVQRFDSCCVLRR